jgi:TRAP transporter TAXI family solute receptor
MRISLVAALAIALCALVVGPTSAQGPRPDAAFDREKERAKANDNLLVLMSGGLGGPYLQLADDIAVVANDEDLRVLPVVSSGGVANVKDILLLKGVDLGITSVQILNDLKASGELGPNLDKQIAYISLLSVDTLHILAGPGVNTLQDLGGKKVAFDLKGSGTARYGPAVLKSLGVSIPEADRMLSMSPGDALLAVRSGEIAAALCSCPIPVPAYVGVNANQGLKLLEVPYTAALEQDYVPAMLTSESYPSLVAKGQSVHTIATSTVLITFNWAPGSDRYRRIERFVNGFFANAHKLREPARHPAWRSVNMAASIRGWQRFPAAQQWLDRQAAEAAAIEAKAASSGIDVPRAREQAAKAAPHDAAEQERLFKEFLEWSKKQPRR